MCPIGFEATPVKPCDAYKKTSEICELDYWIIIGEISRPSPVFHVKKWADVSKDISCGYPYHMNIRKVEEGVK
jgi:hypothetical protein